MQKPLTSIDKTEQVADKTEHFIDKTEHLVHTYKYGYSRFPYVVNIISALHA